MPDLIDAINEGIDERSPNADHIGRLMKLKDDHLARLVGIAKSDAHKFKVEMTRWMKDYTSFPTLKDAFKEFVPTWKDTIH